MQSGRNIFAIIGSASDDSSCHRLVRYVENLTALNFNWTIYSSLKELPHFDPELSNDNPPPSIISLRESISKAHGIIICTPEYVFSIPSGLKNMIEWCVSTTVFSKKPLGIITASANGEKGHAELQLIMKTVETVFTDETTLLIPGVKGKIDKDGNIMNSDTREAINRFVEAFKDLVHTNSLPFTT